MIGKCNTNNIRFSVIIPTCGRPSLYATLYSIKKNGINPFDEVIVVGDGEQPEARRIVGFFRDRLNVVYDETIPSKCLGHAQRNRAMSLATGTHLMFIDDDDTYVNDAFNVVRPLVASTPEKIFMFRMIGAAKRLPYNVLWKTPILVEGNVSTQMFVVPNVRGKLGVWPQKRAGDFDFIKATSAMYGNDIIWREEIIAEIH